MILNKEEGIEISPKVQIGYFAQNGYKFEKEQNVLEFLRKASDYSISEIRSMRISFFYPLRRQETRLA